MFPTMLACLVFAVVAAFELGGATFGAILFRFETLLAFGDFGALFTSLAIRAVLAFDLNGFAALVPAPVLVAVHRNGCVRSARRFPRKPSPPLPCLRRGLPAGWDCSSVQPKRGSADSPTNSNTSGESWVTSIGLTFSPASCSMRRVRRRWFGRTMVTTSPEWCRLARYVRSGEGTISGPPEAPPAPRAPRRTRRCRGRVTSVATHDVHVAGFEGCEIAVTLVLAQVAAARPPECRSSSGPGELLVWNLVRVNRMRRPLPEARVRTSS